MIFAIKQDNPLCIENKINFKIQINEANELLEQLNIKESIKK